MTKSKFPMEVLFNRHLTHFEGERLERNIILDIWKANTLNQQKLEYVMTDSAFFSLFVSLFASCSILCSWMVSMLTKKLLT